MNLIHAGKLALALALAGSTARAHDPLEITSQARLLPGGIELRLTLAASTATRLLKAGPPGADLTPEHFEKLRPELHLRAPDFLTVAADGKSLRPKSLTTELSADGDVKILLQFPPSDAARFQFDAALLQNLPAHGYNVFLLVRGPHDDQAVYGRLTLEEPRGEFPAFPP